MASAMERALEEAAQATVIALYPKRS